MKILGLFCGLPTKRIELLCERTWLVGAVGALRAKDDMCVWFNFLKGLSASKASWENAGVFGKFV